MTPEEASTTGAVVGVVVDVVVVVVDVVVVVAARNVVVVGGTVVVVEVGTVVVVEVGTVVVVEVGTVVVVEVGTVVVIIVGVRLLNGLSTVCCSDIALCRVIDADTVAYDGAPMIAVKITMLTIAMLYFGLQDTGPSFVQHGTPRDEGVLC